MFCLDNVRWLHLRNSVGLLSRFHFFLLTSWVSTQTLELWVGPVMQTPLRIDNKERTGWLSWSQGLTVGDFHILMVICGSHWDSAVCLPVHVLWPLSRNSVSDFVSVNTCCRVWLWLPPARLFFKHLSVLAVIYFSATHLVSVCLFPSWLLSSALYI